MTPLQVIQILYYLNIDLNNIYIITEKEEVISTLAKNCTLLEEQFSLTFW